MLEEPALSEQERTILKDGACRTAAFRFIGNRVLLGGNTSWPIESFSSIYGRFAAIDGDMEGHDISLFYHQEGEKHGPVTFLVNERAYRVTREELIAAIGTTVAYLFMKHIASHYLIHAGCLAREGKGLVISGPSGMGKSTLTAFLAARGMGFLSDELSPLNRRSGAIDAFPMQIGIRPGPATDLLRDECHSVVSIRGDEKRLVSIEDLAGKGPVDSVFPAFVVFLATDTAAKVSTAMKFEGPVRLAVLESNDAFEEGLAALAGVEVLERGDTRGFPSFLLEASHPDRFLPKIRELLNRHGLQLVSLQYENFSPPDYSAPPRIAPIPPAAGVLELVKRIPAYNLEEIARKDFGGQRALLVAEISSLVQGVSFYKLSPGNLEDTLGCLETLGG